MGDFIVYPPYMQRKRTAGDITFGSRDSTGVHISKYTYTDPEWKMIPKSFLIEFKTGGTGSLLKFLKIQ